MRTSVRLWQTELFVVVTVVAILVLSGSLSTGLKRTLTEMGERSAARDVTALAASLEQYFPPTPQGLVRMRATVDAHRAIYGDNVWVYDSNGALLISAYDIAPPEDVLAQARDQGLAQNAPYATMRLTQDGYSVASKSTNDAAGQHTGVVVICNDVDASLAILDAVRGRLWVAFWISLTVAGLLGFTFSEFIGRRVRRMSRAAAAIAAGDFAQRLPTGFVPDEINDLAESYNRMAGKLGEAFAAVQDRERQIAAVVESMAEGVIAFDADGNVRVINPEAVRLLDIPADELTGAPARAITGDPAVLDVVGAGLSGAGVSATAQLGETTVLLHCTPLFDENRTVGGAVLLLADVTEQRRIEEAQRRFVADASHEMRTPIAALKGMLELLNDGAKDDASVRDDFLHTMQLEVERLGRLVADLLTLAQLEAGSFKLACDTYSAEVMLTEVALVMRPLADRAHVTLAVEAPTGDADVVVDRDRIVQVLLGFVDNALKHSPAGATVHLRVKRDADTALFEVADEGSGISADQLAHVFDRFYRADESRSSAGAGLGLAIAREIIEAHGSVIRVESSPDSGTVFSFRLPASPA